MHLHAVIPRLCLQCLRRNHLGWTKTATKHCLMLSLLQSATKLVETVANIAHWQRHIHCLQRKPVQKVRFQDTPPSPTLINVVPLSTRLVENRKTQHCPGGAGEGAICALSLKSTLKDESVSTILTPIVCMKKLCMKCNDDFC